MKARILVLMSGVALFVVLAVPIRLAAQEQPQQSERARSPQTGAANPVPFINQPLVPDATAPGGAGFTLTVNGTGFVSGSEVNWNGSARATTFVSGLQLTAAILASDIALPSTASVTVVNPSPGGGTSNVCVLPVTTPTASISLSRSDLANGPIPQGLATADFNADGKADLAVTTSNNTVSVLLGHGDGTFRQRVQYATAPGPLGVATGDFNRDGRLDLAVHCVDTVSVLLGNGDGTFQPHVDYAVGGVGAFSVAAGDFNGDGKADLVVANNDNPGTVSVLLGNGDGTFKPHVDYSTGGIGPISVAVGDLDDGGNLDLVVPNYNQYGSSSTVGVLLGNGDGTFSAGASYTTGPDPRGAILADFNGDGKLDLALANQDCPTISIFLGNGDGTFQPPVNFTTGFGPGSLVPGDFNGDGKLDLAASNENFGPPGHTLSILLGNGDGTFQAPMNYPVGVGPQQAVTADFNGDGRLDLAVANYNENTVSVLLQATTVSLSNTSLKFVGQLVGTSSPAQTVTLTNTGAITLTISSVVASGDFLQTNNCGSSVPPGASCTIEVSFKPTAKGTRTGALTITDNAADSPQTVALTGTGTVVQLSPEIVDFGNQKVGTTSPAQTITLINTGNTALSIHAIAIAGMDFGDFIYTTTCSSSLPSKASCAVGVRFRPTASGERSASLRVQDDGGGSPQRVRLMGTGM